MTSFLLLFFFNCDVLLLRSSQWLSGNAVVYYMGGPWFESWLHQEGHPCHGLRIAHFYFLWVWVFCYRLPCLQSPLFPILLWRSVLFSCCWPLLPLFHFPDCLHLPLVCSFVQVLSFPFNLLVCMLISLMSPLWILCYPSSLLSDSFWFSFCFEIIKWHFGLEPPGSPAFWIPPTTQTGQKSSHGNQEEFLPTWCHWEPRKMGFITALQKGCVFFCFIKWSWLINNALWNLAWHLIYRHHLARKSVNKSTGRKDL